MTKKQIAVSAAVLAAAAIAGFAVYSHLKSPYKHVSVEEAAAELDGFVFSDPSQHTPSSSLSFDCEVQYCDFSEVYEIEMLYTNNIDYDLYGECSDETRSRCFELLSLFYGGDTSGAELIDEDSHECTYNIENSWASYYESNTFWANDETDNDSPDENTVRAVYAPTDDLSGVTVTLNGESVPLSDAVEFGDTYFRDNITDFMNPEEEQVLTDIIIAENPEYDDCAVVLRYCHMLGGVLLNDMGAFDLDADFIRPSYTSVTVTAKDNVGAVSNSYYHGIGEKKTISSIIPLSEAEDILIDELAPNIDYTVTECELKYVCVTNYESMCEGNQTLRPMWSFTLEEYETWNGESYLSSITAYVDAQSGDVCVYDSELVRFW